MKYGRIPGIGKNVSRIVQGCSILRDAEHQAASNDLLDHAYEAGINAFDHAWEYKEGQCERAFGQWINARNLHDEVVIINKGCHPMNGRNRVSPEFIESDIRDSLERLGVEKLDVWLFHRDDPGVSVEPLIDRLNELRLAGKINSFGGSNWTVRRIREANSYAARNGLVGFTASSPHFSLAEQLESPWGDDCLTISGTSNSLAREWYSDNSLGLLCWSSLAGGFLSGRYRSGDIDQMRKELPDYTIRAYVSPANWKRLQRAEALAEIKGVTVPQIALAYVLSQKMNAFAIVRATSERTIASSSSAAELVLTEAESAWLDLRRESLDETPASQDE